MRSIIIAVVAALAFASTAYAASSSAPKAKVCNPAKSKLCGNTCIALGLACNVSTPGSFGVKKPPGLKKAR
ncbi:MAG TPA: hypothetical protein VHS81_01615 [Caulobacteraceae bacterium]|nr:hypothetical protein [Caulobacteraceae bacterium]